MTAKYKRIGVKLSRKPLDETKWNEAKKLGSEYSGKGVREIPFGGSTA